MSAVKTDKGAARWLVGRTIVQAEMNPFPDGTGPGRMATNPRLVLDDGSVLTFMAQELDCGGDYGVAILRMPRLYQKGGPA